MLAKPGIVYGNLITVAAGFFLASRGHIDFRLFLATLLGTSLVIASSCVVNNYFDRDIDGLMARTKNRALAKNLISERAAIIYAAFLFTCGLGVLAIYTNLLTIAVGLIGVFFYLVMYSVAKRWSIYGTIVGAISGAMPPVGGYTAVVNRLDMGAVLLFLILFFWQMPHFYAIAIYRAGDYRDAGLSVLPQVSGIKTANLHMLFFIVAFIVTTVALTLFGFTGYMYLVIAVVLGFVWLLLCIKGFSTDKYNLWARKMFRYSLVLITILCIMISVDTVR